MNSKHIVMILVLFFFAFVCSASLFAETTFGQTLRWSYILSRQVDEAVAPFFANTNREQKTEIALDLSKGLSDPQVYLGINTNRTSNYSITLTFFPMKNDTDSSDLTNYYYFSRVYFSPDSNTRIGDDLDVDDSSGVSITFDGRTAYSSDRPTQFYYPISFDLGDHRGQYGSGTYKGTIQVEIST